jgi:hypothetical protein
MATISQTYTVPYLTYNWTPVVVPAQGVTAGAFGGPAFAGAPVNLPITAGSAVLPAGLGLGVAANAVPPADAARGSGVVAAGLEAELVRVLLSRLLSDRRPDVDCGDKLRDIHDRIDALDKKIGTEVERLRTELRAGDLEAARRLDGLATRLAALEDGHKLLNESSALAVGSITDMKAKLDAADPARVKQRVEVLVRIVEALKASADPALKAKAAELEKGLQQIK